MSSHAPFARRLFDSIGCLVCANSFRHLEPGGYFEQTEIGPDCICDDGHYRSDSMVKKLCSLRPDLETVTNTNYNLASTMKKMIEEAGFIDVQERVDKCPWSPWADPEIDPRAHRIGQYFEKFYETGVQGWILQPCVKYLQVSRLTLDC